MYAPQLQSQLGYSQLQVNAISIAAELGMYLPVPALGYVADRYGQSHLSVVSAVLFTSAYLISACVVKTAGSHLLLTASFALIGFATSCIYFSVVISCARLFPNSTGFGISAPIAAMGLSSLWESQIIEYLFTDKVSRIINIPGVFVFFAVLYFTVGGMGYFAAKLTGVDHKPVESDESKSLLSESTISADSTALDAPYTFEDQHHRTLSQSNPDPELGIEPDIVVIDSIDSDLESVKSTGQNKRLRIFLTDSTMWLLLLSFLLTIGPLEMYLNNMGAVLKTIDNGPSSSFHVSLFAMFSTLARLTVGVCSDLVEPFVSRATLLTNVLVITGICHFLLAFGIFSSNHGSLFFISSVVNGFSYGTVFTLYPTILATVWGLKSFGTNWGIYMLGPAIGSAIYGLIFATVYDTSELSPNSAVKLCAHGYKCYETTFVVTGTGFLIASALVIYLWHFAWRERLI